MESAAAATEAVAGTALVPVHRARRPAGQHVRQYRTSPAAAVAAEEHDEEDDADEDERRDRIPRAWLACDGRARGSIRGLIAQRAEDAGGAGEDAAFEVATAESGQDVALDDGAAERVG